MDDESSVRSSVVRGNFTSGRRPLGSSSSMLKVPYKLDGDVSQTRAVTDSSILFTFLHCNLVFNSRALPWCLGGAATLLWLLAPFSTHLC